MSVWCERLLRDGDVLNRVRLLTAHDGTVEDIVTGVEPHVGDVRLGTVVPGAGNGHSHAFHRVLRGRTHDQGGDFWVWRQHMYRAARTLDPENYYLLARAVFAEMLTAGYTAVGEFHYVHHQPDGTAYPHEMELAVAHAASDVGIRLTLLDTLYLYGGPGQALSTEQARFGDGNVHRYLDRWHALRERIPGLGAAIHSLRAARPADIESVVRGLPSDVPLHVHVSEQVQENEAVLRAYGRTPTGVLHEAGALGPRTSAVHATHLSADDIELLGAAGSTVVMCPTTEADLGDGIGPAVALLDAGARIALGSDQNAIVDPFLEARSLEFHERLRSRRRGRFTPTQLATAFSGAGYASVGLLAPARIGGFCDLVEVDAASVRLAGSELAQIWLAATAADIRTVVVGGRFARRTVSSSTDTTRPSYSPRRFTRSRRTRFSNSAPTPSAGALFVGPRPSQECIYLSAFRE